MYCLVVFSIFLGLFASLRSSFFDFRKNFAPPPGIRPSFWAPGQGIRPKNCPGGRDSLAQKNFPGSCPGGFTQLELTETLLVPDLGFLPSCPKEKNYQESELSSEYPLPMICARKIYFVELCPERLDLDFNKWYRFP